MKYMSLLQRQEPIKTGSKGGTPHAKQHPPYFYGGQSSIVIANNFLTNKENKKLTFFEKKVKPKNF